VISPLFNLKDKLVTTNFHTKFLDRNENGGQKIDFESLLLYKVGKKIDNDFWH
jgi:hypothetical protein